MRAVAGGKREELVAELPRGKARRAPQPHAGEAADHVRRVACVDVDLMPGARDAAQHLEVGATLALLQAEARDDEGDPHGGLACHELPLQGRRRDAQS